MKTRDPLSRQLRLLIRVTRLIVARWPQSRWTAALAFQVSQRLVRITDPILGSVPTGSRIALKGSDYQHWDIFLGRNYEPEVATLLQRKVSRKTTMYDVGANVGYFALLARDLGATVHAFEPNPMLVKLLRISENLDGRRLHIIPAACGNTAEIRPLYILDDRNSGSSSLAKPSRRAIHVQVNTLDSYWHKTGVAPTLIKIDVEGFEYEVLQGAEQVISTAKPVIIIEVTRQATVDWLERRGYRGRVLGAHDIGVQGRSIDGYGYLNMVFSPVAA